MRARHSGTVTSRRARHGRRKRPASGRSSGVACFRTKRRRILLKAEEDLGRTGRVLARMLDLPPEEANRLEVERSPRLQSIPALADLIPLALKARPDLMALRHGAARAQADVEGATNVAVGSETYFLYQPYTFQGKQSSYNPLGVNITLPIYKRDQGNLARARINLSQTQIQLATTERQIVLQVEQTHRECESSLAELSRLVKERDATLQARDLAERRYESGEARLDDVLKALYEYDELDRRNVELLVENRRRTLELNTAVGERILP